tara:strand:+ start:37 stop:621 length:585 start_codon:yes stop_codon:yes gene_type:complete
MIRKFDKNETLIVVALEKELPKSLVQEWNVCYTGVGKVNALISIAQGISTYEPKTLINYGTAGATDTNISGLQEVTLFKQRDMDARALGFELGETPFDPISSIQLNRPGLSCGTGDNFVTECQVMTVDLVDMEAYAIAKYCLVNRINFYCYKYVSDHADLDSANQWNNQEWLEQMFFKGANLFIQNVLDENPIG